MANVTKVAAEKRAQFLSELASNGANVTKAAAATGISRQEWYRTKREEPEFSKSWGEAIDLGVEALEDEATRRAIHGVSKPVFYQGTQCGIIQEYSDNLLMFKLKAVRPEKYRERQDVVQTVHGEMKLSADWSKLSPEEAATMVRLAEKARP